MCCHGVIVKFFWHSCVVLVTFTYSSKFHVDIITGSGVVTVFVYKGLIRNLQIGNTEFCPIPCLSFAQYPVWVLPNIWRLGRVRDAKFVSNVSNEKLLNASKSQDYSFKRFWVIKENQQGGNTDTHTHARTHTRTHARTHRLDLMNKFHIYLWSIQAKIWVKLKDQLNYGCAIMSSAF